MYSFIHSPDGYSQAILEDIARRLTKIGPLEKADSYESYLETDNDEESDPVYAGELDLERNFVTEDNLNLTQGTVSFDGNLTSYIVNDMEIANESLLANPISQTVEGNLGCIKQKLQTEFELLAKPDQDVESEINLAKLSRYIVSSSKLTELKGNICTSVLPAGDRGICGQQRKFSTSKRGSVLLLSWTCDNKHCGIWSSSEVLCVAHTSEIHVNDILSTACILLSGNNFAKIIQYFKFLNLQLPQESTFYRVQKLFCIPEVFNFWDRMKTTILNVFKQYNDICLSGDGRNDSPGHCARYCCYFVMDQFVKVIVDLEVMDCREVKGVSTNMEQEALQRVLLRLMKVLDLADMTTDASSTLIKQTRELKQKHPELNKLFHSLDIWHKAKSLTKALHKVGI